MTENLINRITYYLSSGGLFNPELADHLAVRNLLMECRDTLEQRTWVGLTDEEIYSVLENLQVMHHRPPTTDSRVIFARAIEAKIKEKNQ